MSLQDLGALGELLAAIATFATLVYLAMQIRHNTRMVKAQIRDSIATKQMNLSGIPATDSELAELLARTFPDPQAENPFGFTPGEQFRVMSMHLLIFREWENSHYQYEEGLFDDSEFQARLETWKGTMAVSAFRASWMRVRETFSSEFREEIDRLAEVADGDV